MALLCIAGLITLIFCVPLKSRIRIRGEESWNLSVFLLFGVLPLWRWDVYVGDDGIQSRIRALFFPAKSTLPAFLQRHKKRKEKHSPFALDLHVERISVECRLPWNVGWEDLRLWWHLQLFTFLCVRILEYRNTDSDFRFHLVAAGEKGKLAGEVWIRIYLWRAVVQTIRKAVFRIWNTRLKN